MNFQFRTYSYIIEDPHFKFSITIWHLPHELLVYILILQYYNNFIKKQKNDYIYSLNAMFIPLGIMKRREKLILNLRI